MCFGGNDDAADEAARARADEEARQARIKAGTARINGIFDGTTVGSGAIAPGTVFDPNGVYYNADGTRWSPTAAAAVRGGGGAPVRQSGPISRGGTPQGLPIGGGGGGGAGGPKGVKGGPKGREVVDTSGQQFGDLVAGGKLFSGTSNTGGFNNDFYAGRRQAYMNYATPQLEDQYGKAQKELIFSLDRSGNLDSTARADKSSELTKMYDIQKQQIADRALSQETQSRNAVEDARANLIATLNATGDAEGAAKSALARSQALTAPAEFSPLASLFTDFTAGLGVQAAQERSYAAGGPAPRYNTGLFGNAGRVSVS